ncbi:acylneuraminate cytidylyltransferase family protein [Planktomarina sp.]|nr:acylneuraminate cytidylyltransferase family protein [Planktomarina sp.]
MIAIIPARGGSKGLPGKNIKLLNDVPLIGHTILSAIKAKSISRVIVSTDDDEIAQIAKEWGAEVPFMRPSKLAGDEAMVMDAYLYTVDRLALEDNIPINTFVALLPTVPLRLSTDIDAAVAIFFENNADSVISVTEAPVPIDWYKKIDTNGTLTDFCVKANSVANRQELAKGHVPNGAIYIFKTEKLRQTRQYYMEKTYPYIMPRDRSADIDEPLDFEWAEFLLNRKGT